MTSSPIWKRVLQPYKIPSHIKSTAPNFVLGANAIKLSKTCHSEAVTDVTAVGIRI